MKQNSSTELPDPPLLVVTDRRQARRPLEGVIEAALAGGCRWISLREKDLPADEQMLLARALLPIVHQYGAVLTLHGDGALARLSGIDGVHLPAGSNAAVGRADIRAEKLLGVSIHTKAEAASVDPAWADYAVAGPVYETASKPGYGPQLGFAGLADIVRAARVPVIAIGGVDPTRIGDIVAAGAAGVAVMGGIMRAADPAQEVRALVAALAGAIAGRSG